MLVLLLAGCSPVHEAPPSQPLLRPSETPLPPSEPTATAMPRSIALTEPGCCARPWWSPDGGRVLFVDDPDGPSPLGVYSVAASGGAIRLEQDMSEDPASGLTLLLDPARAELAGFRLPQDAQQVHLSPDVSRAAWTEGGTQVWNVDTRQRRLSFAERGAAPRRIGTLIGGGLLGWSADGRSLLVSGGLLGESGRGIWSVPIESDPPRLLLEVTRARSPLLSPGSRWLAFYQAFDPDPSQNGVWILRIDDGFSRRLGELASYRWSGDGQLLYIPFDSSARIELWRLDAASGETTPVAGPDRFPGGIAANDWSVSPQGDRIVYRAAKDGRLWSVWLGDR